MKSRRDYLEAKCSPLMSSLNAFGVKEFGAPMSSWVEMGISGNSMVVWKCREKRNVDVFGCAITM